MESIALITDIHANLPAFKSVLRDVQDSGATEIVFLGDIVGYGASPAECVRLVRRLGGKCVMGNHDCDMAMYRNTRFGRDDPRRQKDGYLAGLIHAADTLPQEDAEWLAKLPFAGLIKDAHAAHGSLDDPEVFNYIEDAESAAYTLAILAEEKYKIGFFGHTHQPNIFSEDDTKLEWINETSVRIPEGLACAVTVGSCGQPRTPDDLRACWALWKPAERIVEFKRTEYSRLHAAQDIAKAGLPLETAARLLNDAEFAAVFGEAS
jgi:predicted phosphodiesterase